MTDRASKLSLEAGAAAPLVSIVIANFNYARFLREAAGSALSQSYPLVETIIVDDGSTDDSETVLRQLQAEHPGLTVIRRANGGQAAAMNTGLSALRGEWVLFLDADDRLEPNAVERLLTATSADATLVQFYLATIDTDGARTGLHPFCERVEGGQLLEQICASGHFRFMPTSGNLFRRSALDRIAPMPEDSWKICADTYLTLTAAMQGRVAVVREILGAYRVHDANNWYRAQEDDARSLQIVRNHVIVWRQIVEALPRLVPGADGFVRLSLVRRIAASLYMLQGRPAFPKKTLREIQRSLAVQVARSGAPPGEMALHLALVFLSTARSRLGRSAFRALMGAGDGPLARFAERFRSPRRFAWMGKGSVPAAVSTLDLDRSYDFGRGGDGRHFQRFGLSEVDNWRSWATAERAGLMFRLPPGRSPFSVDLTVAPLPARRQRLASG
ncbi:glycosyltransferase family 2 protein [Mesorhizobium sp. ORM8.1]